MRATQFFEFLSAIAGGSTDGDVVRVSSAHMQPIAAADVATAMTKDDTGGPTMIRAAAKSHRWIWVVVDPCGIIPKTDPYAFYLSYHEGHAGYRRGTYRHKRRLLEVAEEGARLTRRYARQLSACDAALRAAGDDRRPAG